MHQINCDGWYSRRPWCRCYLLWMAAHRLASTALSHRRNLGNWSGRSVVNHLISISHCGKGAIHGAHKVLVKSATWL